MVSISRYSKFKFVFSSICTREETITGKPMYLTLEVEDEVIRKTVSHKLDRHIFNPSNKFWRDSTQNKTPNSPFQIGEYLRYTNRGHNYMVDLVDINTNDPDSTKYSIEFLRVNTMIVTKKSLKSTNVPDI